MEVPNIKTEPDHSTNQQENQLPCRFCAKVFPSVIQIYSEQGLTNQIPEKINEYLPTKVSPVDKLPLSSCWHCYNMLMSWHEFVQLCKDSEKKLSLIDGAFNVRKDSKVEEVVKVTDLCLVKLEQCDEITPEEQTVMKGDVDYVDEQSFRVNEADVDTESPILLKCEVDSENEVVFGEEDGSWEGSIETESLEEGEEEDVDSPDCTLIIKPKETHVCVVCNLKFRSSRGLQSHLTRKHESHTEVDQKSSKCADCGIIFNCDLNLKSHIWNVHTEEPKVLTQEEKWRDWELMKLRCRVFDGFNKVLYKCPECFKLFRRASFVINHQTKHTGAQLFQCNKCDKRFSHRQTLSSHLANTHSEVKKYECKECGAKFRKITYLKNHSSLHSGEKSFVCEKCGKSYMQMSGLKSHLRTHSDYSKKFRFECGVCNKKFCRACDLKKHTALHTIERPYQCDKCKAHFTTKEVLEEHQKKHLDPTKLFCQYCGSSFGLKTNLYKHRKNCAFRKS